MEINAGYLYFIKDDFFNKVQDKNLKMDYTATKRPHFLAFKETGTELLWVVPCSSRIEKFEKLIEDKKAKGKPTDGIKIVKIFDEKQALCFQDMFPVIRKFIQEPYIKGGQAVGIADPSVVDALEKHARKVIGILNRGVKFTPQSPDVERIKSLMLSEVEKDRSVREAAATKDDNPKPQNLNEWRRQMDEMRKSVAATKEAPTPNRGGNTDREK